MSNFHNRLKKLRKQNSFTQADVGKFLDYGYTTISNYESGVSTDFLLGHDSVADDSTYKERVNNQLEDMKKNLLSAVEDINNILEPENKE